MKPETIIQSLDEVVPPLVDLFNSKYATDELEEYLVPMPGRFGAFEYDDDETAIECPNNINDHERAMRAVATLLRVTGSQAVWIGHNSSDDAMIQGPLRFRLTKTAAWAGYFWKWTRNLVIDHAGDDLDLEAATGQVAELVAHLENEANLIELGPEERAMF